MSSNVYNLIKEFNSQNNPIGTIDIYFWFLNKYEALYYFYPLLERLIVHIVSLESRVGVEVNDSARLKTANSILSNNIVINEAITNKLIDIFKEDGLRNCLLHGGKFKNNRVLLNHLLDVKCLVLILMRKYLENDLKFSDNNK